MELSQLLSQIKTPFTDEKVEDLIYQYLSFDMDYYKMYSSINSTNNLIHSNYTAPCHRDLRRTDGAGTRKDDRNWYYVIKAGVGLNKYDFNPEFRIYLNAKGKDKTDIVRQYVQEQLRKDRKFVLKYSKKDGRQDEVVVWCSKEDLPENIDFLQQILSDKKIGNPPPLVGTLDGKIGIGEEYTKQLGLYSYTQLRLSMIPLAMEKYLMDHYEEIIPLCNEEEKKVLDDYQKIVENAKQRAKIRLNYKSHEKEAQINLNALNNNIPIEEVGYKVSFSKTELSLLNKVLGNHNKAITNEIIKNFRICCQFFGISSNGVISMESAEIIQASKNRDKIQSMNKRNQNDIGEKE